MNHGTLNAYKNGRCRCAECSEASYRYEKRRKYLIHIGLAPTLPAVGFKRRVRALMAMGWTQREIAEALGIAAGNLALKLRTNQTVTRATHVAMCDLYERLAMTLPPDTVSNRRTRDLSRRRGYLPPLAWDDIDDENERPARTTEPAGRKGYLDHAAIERRLDGDRSVRVTHDEAAEVVRRALRAGRSTTWIEENLSLKPERYTKKGDAA